MVVTSIVQLETSLTGPRVRKLPLLPYSPELSCHDHHTLPLNIQNLSQISFALISSMLGSLAKPRHHCLQGLTWTLEPSESFPFVAY
jgi:hypothetical protein